MMLKRYLLLANMLNPDLIPEIVNINRVIPGIRSPRKKPEGQRSDKRQSQKPYNPINIVCDPEHNSEQDMYAQKRL